MRGYIQQRRLNHAAAGKIHGERFGRRRGNICRVLDNCHSQRKKLTIARLVPPLYGAVQAPASENARTKILAGRSNPPVNVAGGIFGFAACGQGELRV
jgi:hypothetical protein